MTVTGWLPVLKWVGIAGAVSALLWWAVVSPRLSLSAERGAHAETKAAHAAVIADLAAKTQIAADKAKAASETVRTERAALDAAHKEN